MSLANALKKVAAKQLKKFGVEVIITRLDSDQYEPVNDNDYGSALSFIGYGYVDNYSSYNLNTTTIKAGDVKLLLEATDVVPKIGDKVSLNGLGDFNIVSISNILVNEEVITYEVQLRA